METRLTAFIIRAEVGHFENFKLKPFKVHNLIVNPEVRYKQFKGKLILYSM